MYAPRAARLSVWLLMALALWFVAADAYGRAGGGGGHAGGSHSSGHSGGFSSGRSSGHSGGYGGGGYVRTGGGSSRPMSRNELVTTVVMMLVVIAALIAFNYFQTQQRQQAIRDGIRAVDAARDAEIAEQIQTTDPQFDRAAFLARVQAAFLIIQKAWSEQNLDPLRPFVSDGVWERFALQVQEQRERGIRNVMDDVKVLRENLARFDVDGMCESLAIKVLATASDYDLSLADNRIVRGSKGAEEFTEIWTFIRRKGAISLAGKPGLIEGRCPNCGAELPINQAAQCPACQSLIRSGQFDWVLCEITQECEWSADHRSTRGLAEYCAQSDQQFSAPHLEDRASVIFWRNAMADRLGQIAPLAKVAAPEFCEAYTQRLAREQDQRFFTGNCAVGSVDLIAVVAAQPLHKALIEIRWTGTRFVSRAGQPAESVGEPVVRRSFFELGRRADVKSDAAHGFASAHCPQCGAPESNSAANACEFCGQVLNDGSGDWVLLAIHSGGDFDPQVLSEQWLGHSSDAPSDRPSGMPPPLPARPREMDLLAWAARISACDGEIAAAERAALLLTAGKQGVSEDTIEHLLQAAGNDACELPMPKSREEGRMWVAVLGNQALEDGKVTNEEFSLLCHLGESVGLAPADLRLYLHKRQAQLAAAAQSYLQKAPQRPTGGATAV